jgi:hypothetical protein
MCHVVAVGSLNARDSFHSSAVAREGVEYKRNQLHDRTRSSSTATIVRHPFGRDWQVRSRKCRGFFDLPRRCLLEAADAGQGG